MVHHGKIEPPVTTSGSFRTDAHAVVVGINLYADPLIPDLRFARADAEAIYNVLTDPELGRFHPDNVTLLLDEAASQRRIRSAIGTQLPQRTRPEDTVCIFFAGHGAPVIDPQAGSKDGLEKYLVPYDAEAHDLRASGIPMAHVEDFFGWIDAKQILFFIDCCYSGDVGGRTFPHPRFQPRSINLTDEFLRRLSGEGRVVITACSVNELSLEAPEIGHGIFSHYLLDGLRGAADVDGDGMVTLDELYPYVYRNVEEHARRLGGRMQPSRSGQVKGLVYLTQYETEEQRRLHRIRQAAEEALAKGDRYGALKGWQEVLRLSPEDEEAKAALNSIPKVGVAHKKQGEAHQRQDAIDAKLRQLLEYHRSGQLPVNFYVQAFDLIEREGDTFDSQEREIYEFIDHLLEGRINAAQYLKSVHLLTAEMETQPELQQPSNKGGKVPGQIGGPNRAEDVDARPRKHKGERGTKDIPKDPRVLKANKDLRTKENSSAMGAVSMSLRREERTKYVGGKRTLFSVLLIAGLAVIGTLMSFQFVGQLRPSSPSDSMSSKAIVLQELRPTDEIRVPDPADQHNRDLVAQAGQPGERNTGESDSESGESGKPGVDGLSRRPGMVHIVGGTFMMGSDEGNANERPIHSVTVSSFEISKTEVTVGQYRICVEEGGCSDFNQFKYQAGHSCNWFRPDREDHPINCVSWDEARAYAEWLGEGYRLPTEAEWEYAARGLGRDIWYPWGNEDVTCEHAVTRNAADGSYCRNGRTQPVCSRPKGDTPQGLCDMAGNVREWVEDDCHRNYQGAPTDGSAWIDSPRHFMRVLRGGAWDGLTLSVTSRCQTHNGPYVGFRVARSLESRS